MILNPVPRLIITGYSDSSTLYSVEFDYCKAGFSVSPYYVDYKNIFGRVFSLLKGHLISSSVSIEIPQNLSLSDGIFLDKINKLITFLQNISLQNMIELKIVDNAGIELKKMSFDRLKSNINYSEFYNDNSKLGLTFDFELETTILKNSSDVPKGWTI